MYHIFNSKLCAMTSIYKVRNIFVQFPLLPGTNVISLSSIGLIVTVKVGMFMLAMRLMSMELVLAKGLSRGTEGSGLEDEGLLFL